MRSEEWTLSNLQNVVYILVSFQKYPNFMVADNRKLLTNNVGIRITIKSPQEEIYSNFSFIGSCILGWSTSSICIRRKRWLSFLGSFGENQTEKSDSLTLLVIALGYRMMIIHTFPICRGIRRLPVSCLLLCGLEKRKRNYKNKHPVKR
jgi:hypothetical protein